VYDWRSPCCHDELSEDPVTDRCDQCGEIAARGAEFPKIEDETFCPGCLADYRADHPRLENLPEDDWRKDR
jgi:hypothetical protein